MQRSFFILSIFALVGLALGSAWSLDDQKDTKKDQASRDDSDSKDSADSKSTTRLRGQLPANYRRLSLSEEQTQKIYKIQADYADKIRDLEEKIKAAKAEEKKKIEAVLTPAQLARLKEILKEKIGDK